MQSAIEVKLMRELLLAAKSRTAAPDPMHGVGAEDAARAGHAVATPWDILTTIAAALGYTVSDAGSLQEHIEV